MKNNGDSFYKTIKFFMLSSICTLLAVLVLYGFCQVGMNTNKISTGEDGATLAIAHNEQRLEIMIDTENAAAINLPPHESLDFIFGLSPVLWLCQSIYELISSL